MQAQNMQNEVTVQWGYIVSLKRNTNLIAKKIYKLNVIKINKKCEFCQFFCKERSNQHFS